MFPHKSLVKCGQALPFLPIICQAILICVRACAKPANSVVYVCLHGSFMVFKAQVQLPGGGSNLQEGHPLSRFVRNLHTTSISFRTVSMSGLFAANRRGEQRMTKLHHMPRGSDHSIASKIMSTESRREARPGFLACLAVDLPMPVLPLVGTFATPEHDARTPMPRAAQSETH